MTFIQALLIGLIAGLTVLDGNWLGEAKFREPVVTGFLVGLALGDVTKGLKVGAELQLLWMGATGIGPTAQLDIGTGGTIGAAVVNIPWWRSHPIHENRATESICTEPCNPLLRATKSMKRATSTY